MACFRLLHDDNDDDEEWRRYSTFFIALGSLKFDELISYLLWVVVRIVTGSVVYLSTIVLREKSGREKW